MRLVKVGLVLLVIGNCVLAATIRVPQDQPTIQAGMSRTTSTSRDLLNQGIPFDTLSTSIFGTERPDYITKGCFTRSPSGEITAVANTQTLGSGLKDIVLHRFDQSGNLVWSRILTLPGDQYGNAIATSFDNALLIGGVSQDTMLVSSEYLLTVIRCDSAGNMIWLRQFQQGMVQSLVTTADSGFVAVGQLGYGSPPIDPLLMRCDATGDTLWTRKVSDVGSGALHKVTIASDGEILAAGKYWPDASTYVPLFMKLQDDGTILWQTTLTGTDNSAGAIDLEELQTGEIMGFGWAGNQPTISLLGPDGDSVWTKTVSSPGHSTIRDAISLSNSEFLLTGYYYLPPDFSLKHLWLAEINSTGALVWESHYGGSVMDQGEGLLGIGTGSFIVIGETRSFGQSSLWNPDIWLLHFACNAGPEITAFQFSGQAPLTHFANHKPVLTWEESDPCNLPQVAFHVQVGTTGDMGSVLWDIAVQGDQDSITYDGIDLEDGMNCYARLSLNNGHAWSQWSEFAFRMNSVPTIPELVAPANGGIVTSPQPSLTIRRVPDAEGDSLLLTFEIAGDSLFSSFVPFTAQPSSDSLTTVNVPFYLTEDQRYWWRVKASDYYEESAYSAIWSFWLNSENIAPTPFELRSPPDGLTPALTTTTPILQWTRSRDFDPFDSVRYELHIALYPNFSFATIIEGITDTSFQISEPLSWGTNYWWKVKATDLSTGVTWSDQVFSFRVMKIGDPDGNGQISISDAVFLINYIFAGGPAPVPLLSGDADCSGAISISDAVYLINYIFAAGPAPCEP